MKILLITITTVLLILTGYSDDTFEDSLQEGIREIENNEYELTATSFEPALNKQSETEKTVKQEAEQAEMTKAYYQIISEIVNKYGVLSSDEPDPMEIGLAFADLIDFNNDGKEELYIIYAIEPNSSYYEEIWGSSNGELKKLYSKEFYNGGRISDAARSMVTVDSKTYLVETGEYSAGSRGVIPDVMSEFGYWNIFHGLEDGAVAELATVIKQDLIFENGDSETRYKIRIDDDEQAISKEEYNTYLDDFNYKSRTSIIDSFTGSKYLAFDVSNNEEIIKEFMETLKSNMNSTSKNDMYKELNGDEKSGIISFLNQFKDLGDFNVNERDDSQIMSFLMDAIFDHHISDDVLPSVMDEEPIIGNHGFLYRPTRVDEITKSLFGVTVTPKAYFTEDGLEFVKYQDDVFYVLEPERGGSIEQYSTQVDRLINLGNNLYYAEYTIYYSWGDRDTTFLNTAMETWSKEERADISGYESGFAILEKESNDRYENWRLVRFNRDEILTDLEIKNMSGQDPDLLELSNETTEEDEEDEDEDEDEEEEVAPGLSNDLLPGELVTDQPIKNVILILSALMIIGLPIYGYNKKVLTKETYQHYFLKTLSGGLVICSSAVFFGTLLLYPDPSPLAIDETLHVNQSEEEEEAVKTGLNNGDDIDRFNTVSYDESGDKIDNDILEAFLRLMANEDMDTFLATATEPTQIGPYRVQMDGNELIFLSQVIEVEAPYEGAEIHMDGKHIATVDETGVVQVEWIARGNDTLTVNYEDPISGAAFEIEQTFSVGDLQDSSGHLYFNTLDYPIHYINVSTDYNDAILLVDDTDTGLTFETSEVFGPVALDGSTHISAKRDFNGETFYTEPQYLVEDKSHYFLSFGHESLLIEANSEELFEAVNQHVAEWMQSSIEHDDRYFSKLASDYRTDYLERVNRNFDDQRAAGYRYEGYVEKATFDEDSFQVYEHTEDRIVTAIDVKFTFQSNYYSGNQDQSTHPLTESTSVWTYVLDYSVDTEEWLILDQEELTDWNPSSARDVDLLN